MAETNDDSFPNGDDEFVFDPFGLHTPQDPDPNLFPIDDNSSTSSPQPPPQVTRLTRSAERQPPSTGENVETSKSVALPPRMVIKFICHEKVCSVAETGPDNEGASEVRIQGNLSAQVTSSDAMKNAPFCLVASTAAEDHIQFTPNPEYSSISSRPLPRDALSLIHIPKTDVTAVPIGSYSVTENVRHMPLLVERKVTMFGDAIRVAVQVRSKLSNNGDIIDFTIAVAVPERVNGETVEVSRGNGVYDDLKRTIKWNVRQLPKGESFMVSAQAQLWSSATKQDQVSLKFPVLLKCNSFDDQISNVELRAVEADGFPSTVSFNRSFSFQLLHRLP